MRLAETTLSFPILSRFICGLLRPVRDVWIETLEMVKVHMETMLLRPVRDVWVEIFVRTISSHISPSYVPNRLVPNNSNKNRRALSEEGRGFVDLNILKKIKN